MTASNVGARTRNRGVCLPAFPSFLPHPLPALLLAPVFARSLTLVPRSLLLNRAETLATQAMFYLKLFYKSNRPHFLWIYQRDNLHGLFGEHDPNTHVPHLKILTNPTRVSHDKPDFLGKSLSISLFTDYSFQINISSFPGR